MNAIQGTKHIFMWSQSKQLAAFCFLFNIHRSVCTIKYCKLVSVATVPFSLLLSSDWGGGLSQLHPAGRCMENAILGISWEGWAARLPKTVQSQFKKREKKARICESRVPINSDWHLPSFRMLTQSEWHANYSVPFLKQRSSWGPQQDATLQDREETPHTSLSTSTRGKGRL